MRKQNKAYEVNRTAINDWQIGISQLFQIFHGLSALGITRLLGDKGGPPHPLYRGVLTPGCWNRGVPLYTEVSSLQGVGIEVYRGVLTPGCWNREVPLYIEVSSLQGVGIEGFHCIQRCPHSRVLE